MVLSTLARSDAYRSIILSNGGLDTLLTGMTTFPEDLELITAAIRTCCEIGQLGGPARRQLVDVGLLPVVVRAMREHARSMDLQLAACNLFQLLTGVCWCACEVAVDEGPSFTPLPLSLPLPLSPPKRLRTTKSASS